MVDFSQARRTMVDSQLRTFDVNDIPLLDAIAAVPREAFVMPGRESLAYSDQELPVSDGPDRRFMLTPAVLARLIQALEINSGDAVLDVACGRGYASAIMGLLGATVTGLESDEALAESARRSLADAGIATVSIKVGNLAHGHKQPEGFDAILINGALDVKPETLLNQLKDGGRLACVMGRGRSARATLFVRAGDAFGERALFDAAAPVLAAFQAKPGFKF